MNPRYVFVVGLPKSGTKLIESILSNSPHVEYRSSGETFFLGHLLSPGVRHRIRRLGDLKIDDNVDRLVDYLFSGKPPGGYWRRLHSGKLGVEREILRQAILRSDRSERAIYQVILRVHTPVTERTILGDKTPSHLYHVPTLIEWFPEARVVHTFRDPRAILASEWRKRTGGRVATHIPFKPGTPLYSFAIVVHVTISWLYAVRLHHRYAQRYPDNYYLSKFEDLVSEPESAVRRLCRFLDVPFDAEMLNPRRAGSSYQSEAQAGFDRQALTRWQGALKPWMNRWLLWWGGRQLREFGYLA